jgi:hypothetical protein
MERIRFGKCQLHRCNPAGPTRPAVVVVSVAVCIVAGGAAVCIVIGGASVCELQPAAITPRTAKHVVRFI